MPRFDLPKGAGYGEAAKSVRIKLRKTLKQVAEALEFSIQHLSDIELGRRNPPSREKVNEHARVLGVDPVRFQELALIFRRVVELPIGGDATPAKDKLALVLARKWDGLTENEAAELLSRLEEVAA